jgi:hypothetical protein
MRLESERKVRWRLIAAASGRRRGEDVMLHNYRCLGRHGRVLALMIAVLLLGFLAGLPLGPNRAVGPTVLAAPASTSTEPPQAAPQQPFPRSRRNDSRGLSAKQRRDLLKHNFEKMKRDADELAELAQSLREDLNVSNENVLSIEIVEKAKKIEKLAKKIKSAAKGF